jgi:hypothetical protein
VLVLERNDVCGGAATGGPSQVENLYARAALEEAFAGFAGLKISAHDSMTQEGTGHAGMATLIDLVGRK